MMPDGVPLAAWQAALAGTDDPQELRELARAMLEHLQALRRVSVAAGVEVPRLFVPQRGESKCTPQKGV